MLLIVPTLYPRTVEGVNTVTSCLMSQERLQYYRPVLLGESPTMAQTLFMNGIPLNRLTRGMYDSS